MSVTLLSTTALNALNEAQRLNKHINCKESFIVWQSQEAGSAPKKACISSI